ncbi:MAG: hypothetical protein ACPHO0_02165 [Luminiphilus sp.]
MAISSAAMFIGSKVVSGLLTASSGSSAKKAAGVLADRTVESGERQAGLLEQYAVRQEEYAGMHDAYAEQAANAVRKQAGLRYLYAEKAADLEEQEIPLMLLGIERQVKEEERLATDREIGRRRQLNQALASQVALRTAQGIQAYDGSPLAMMGADMTQFERDQAIDKADTARRIVDNRFFGSERAKLMADRVSLLRFGAATELEAGMEQAVLVGTQAALQAESIRMAAEGTMMSAESRIEASQLEAEAIRIQGKTAQTSSYINAANTLLDAGFRYSQLGG